MPYIVTTKEPVHHPGEAVTIREGDYVPPRGRHAGGSQGATGSVQADLNDYASTSATDGDYDRVSDQLQTLPESGGTIGPLPDGTVIEVKQWREEVACAWAHFYGPDGVSRWSDLDEVIAAYNAAQEKVTA